MPKRVEKYLEYVPLPSSEHVYVNGVEQRFNRDYVIENQSYVVLPRTLADGSPGACESGDKVEVLYAHLGTAGTPPPEILTNPDDALPGCFGTTNPFPWQSRNDTLSWTFVTADWNVAKFDGEYVNYELTIHSVASYCSGVNGSAMYLDGWAYFRKPDGCIEPFNFITGNISIHGFGPYNGNIGPFPVGAGTQNHPLPSGSKLVAASMSTSCNHGRIYNERRP